jgi:DNA-3-methyladenine glycosylase
VRTVQRLSRAKLDRSFFARPSAEVARDLLGRLLVRELSDGQRLVARIVETEAYQEDDPASHSFRGLTERTRVMFGPPGHLYVYFIYGMHFCMNVVTGRDGEGSAVLLRAAEPLEGLREMIRRRRVESGRLLCSGPGRLCEALGIGRSQNGTDLVGGRELRVVAGQPIADEEATSTPRVGVIAAHDKPWRFLVKGNPHVSRGPSLLRGSPRG